MSTLVEEQWNEILEFLKKEYGVTDVSYRTWLQPLEIAGVDDEKNEITISVDETKVGVSGIQHIENRYSQYLRTAIAEFTNIFYNLHFILSSQLDENADVSVGPFQGSSDLSSIETYSNLNPKYTFDTFVIGPNNNLAHAAALAVAESPGESYNPLFIYGGSGLGKTHLMHSIARYVIDENPRSKVIYVTSEKFTNDLIESIRTGSKNNTTPTEFRDKYRNVDVLLIDDIQFIIGKESTQEELFHTFNTLYEAKKQIIISSDKPPKDMITLEDRLRSRFEWGLTVDIQQPDYETRMAILKKKREELGAATVDDEVLNYIVTNIKSNIRELEGALTKVNALSCLKKQDVTVSLAEEALKDLISPNKDKVVTVEDIVNIAAEHFGISQNEIYSNNRSRNVAYPRQIAMYLSKKFTPNSITDIGRMIGNRDHSTVLHALSKIEKDLSKNKNDICAVIDVLIKKINPPQ